MKICSSPKKKISWSLYLKNDPIRLYPGQIKRYAFALPIVADTTETALASTTIFEAKGWSRAFDRPPSISAEPLHAMQKVVYKPLRFSELYPNISYIFPSAQVLTVGRHHGFSSHIRTPTEFIFSVGVLFICRIRL